MRATDLSLKGGHNEHPKPAETAVADVVVAGEANAERRYVSNA
jgi:hypothetical protein